MGTNDHLQERGREVSPVCRMLSTRNVICLGSPCSLWSSTWKKSLIYMSVPKNLKCWLLSDISLLSGWDGAFCRYFSVEFCRTFLWTTESHRGYTHITSASSPVIWLGLGTFWSRVYLLKCSIVKWKYAADLESGECNSSSFLWLTH